MMRLVLVRHGQSVWNLENRFTGWTDVGLSENGIKEAILAGKKLKDNGFSFDVAYTSVLRRANDTLDYIVSNDSNEELPSTIVDLTQNEIKIIREGKIRKEDILKVLGD